jgi:hypothetical protein
LITATTPVRPMPFHHLVAAERPAEIGHAGGGAVDVEQKLGVLVEIAAPGGDFGQQFGETVLDGHGCLLCPSRWTCLRETASPAAVRVLRRQAGQEYRNVIRHLLPMSHVFAIWS